MVKPNARSSGMAIVINRCPPSGISLRWARQGWLWRILFNSVKRLRKNNSIKASILFFSWLSPNLTALKTIQYRPPCTFHWSAILSIHTPLLPGVFGWLLCLFLDWGPPKTTTNFVCLLFLLLNSTVETILSLPRLYSFDWAVSWLVVVSPHPLEAIESQGPIALSIFLMLHSTPPNGGQKSSPTSSAQSRLLCSVLSTAEIIVWLVVAFLYQMVATQDCWSAHFWFFWWVPFGRPNQPIQLQQSWALAFSTWIGRKAEQPLWQNGVMAERQNGRTAERQNGRMAEWQNGRMAEWQNGRMAERPEWLPTYFINGTCQHRHRHRHRHHRHRHRHWHRHLLIFYIIENLWYNY